MHSEALIRQDGYKKEKEGGGPKSPSYNKEENWVGQEKKKKRKENGGRNE